MERLRVQLINFYSQFVAFPGILNWQKRIWLTISDLVELRTSDVPCGSDKEFEEQERILWDSRNYYVSGATFHFKHTQHISSAISNMQGLTNFIRVSHILSSI